MADVQLMGLLNATLQAATLLFIAALGELITEKSGILNPVSYTHLTLPTSDLV